MNSTNTDTEILIYQPGYLFMIVFFGFWCIASMLMQIDKCHKKKNNIIVESNRDSDSECSYYEEEEYNKIKTNKIKTFSNVNIYPKFCSICQENVLNSVQIDCGHSYCKDCIEQHTQKNVDCPLCRQGIKNIYEIEVLIFK